MEQRARTRARARILCPIRPPFILLSNLKVPMQLLHKEITPLLALRNLRAALQRSTIFCETGHLGDVDL